MRRAAWPVALLALAVLACDTLSPRQATPAPSALPPSATAPATLPARATIPPTRAPSATLPPTKPPTKAASATILPTQNRAPSATPVPEATTESNPSATPGQAGPQSFLAYVKQGQLLVTDVTGGAVGGTTQYTQAGVNDGVYDLVWSPSGQFIVFVAAGAGRDAHVYVVYAVGAGTPADLGPGSQPNWSPDSTRIAFVRDGNVWITPVDNPHPRALTHKQNWGWGRPTFTPAGDALVIGGQPVDNVGAQGNTEFDLETLPLDGSGTLTPLPGMTQMISGRLPDDLSFSPDGTKLAFSTSLHISACASAGSYYVSNADGSGVTQVNSRRLSALLQPNQDFYYIVLGFAWKPSSDGLLITSFVVDCTNFAGIHLGETLSSVTLTGAETVLGVGFFAWPSYDHGGTLLAVAQPDPSGGTGQVALYDAKGHPVATVGPGDRPAFQP